MYKRLSVLSQIPKTISSCRDIDFPGLVSTPLHSECQINLTHDLNLFWKPRDCRTYPTELAFSRFALTFVYMPVRECSGVVSDEFTRWNVFKFCSCILYIAVNSSMKHNYDFLVQFVAITLQKPENSKNDNFTTMHLSHQSIFLTIYPYIWISPRIHTCTSIFRCPCCSNPGYPNQSSSAQIGFG